MGSRLGALQQLVLNLVGGKAGTFDKGIEAGRALTERGPRGEYYTFPKDANLSKEERVLYSHLRRLIDQGLINPADNMNLASIPMSQAAKLQKAASLAGTIKRRGLPDKSAIGMDPQFDAIALKLNQQGTKADAAAALGGPQSTKDPRAMFLYDLAATDVPGAGGHLLSSVLKGPLYPETKELLFTPLGTDDTMNFYRKFGMEYVSPKDVLTDKRLSEMMDWLGEMHNAEDLGVGIIKRKKGGLAQAKGAHRG